METSCVKRCNQKGGSPSCARTQRIRRTSDWAATPGRQSAPSPSKSPTSYFPRRWIAARAAMFGYFHFGSPTLDGSAGKESTNEVPVMLLLKSITILTWTEVIQLWVQFVELQYACEENLPVKPRCCGNSKARIATSRTVHNASIQIYIKIYRQNQAMIKWQECPVSTWSWCWSSKPYPIWTCHKWTSYNLVFICKCSMTWYWPIKQIQLLFMNAIQIAKGMKNIAMWGTATGNAVMINNDKYTYADAWHVFSINTSSAESGTSNRVESHRQKSHHPSPITSTIYSGSKCTKRFWAHLTDRNVLPSKREA